jgi:hypothetical protein
MLLQNGGAVLLNRTAHAVTDPRSHPHPDDSGPATRPMRRPRCSVLAATTRGVS